MSDMERIHEMEYLDDPYPEDAGNPCQKCGNEMDWQDCELCVDGFAGHDCGEDTCCCADPEDNVICDVCDGEEGWYVCHACANDAERAS